MAGESSAAGSDVKAKAGLRCYRMLEAVILTVVIVAVCGVFTVPTIFFALRPTVVSQNKQALSIIDCSLFTSAAGNNE